MASKLEEMDCGEKPIRLIDHYNIHDIVILAVVDTDR